MSNGEIKNHASFIKSIAELLRGTYKQSDYGKVILPLAVIRRLDCVLEPTKDAVLKRAKALKGKVENVEPVLCSVAGEQFYNISPPDLHSAARRPIAANLRSYIGGFTEAAASQTVWRRPLRTRPGLCRRLRGMPNDHGPAAWQRTDEEPAACSPATWVMFVRGLRGPTM